MDEGATTAGTGPVQRTHSQATILAFAFRAKSPGKNHPAHQLLAHMLDAAPVPLALCGRK